MQIARCLQSFRFCRSGLGLGIGNFNRFSCNFDVPSLAMDFENRWTRAVVPNFSCTSQSPGSLKTNVRPRLHPAHRDWDV